MRVYMLVCVCVCVRVCLMSDSPKYNTLHTYWVDLLGRHIINTLVTCEKYIILLLL